MEPSSNEIREYTATANDLARRYGVHRNTVYGWVEQTDIPHRKLPGSIRFNLEEVDEWMRARSQPSTKAGGAQAEPDVEAHEEPSTSLAAGGGRR